MAINEDYNKALQIYDNLSEKEKISFKEYVFCTWPALNPWSHLRGKLVVGKAELNMVMQAMERDNTSIRNEM